MTTPSTFKQKNFNNLSPERRSEISSIGGRAAHLQGKAHKFTSEEAREAGRKGGLARAAKRNQVKAS